MNMKSENIINLVLPNILPQQLINLFFHSSNIFLAHGVF